MTFQRIRRIVWRGLTLSCPRCGQRTLFSGFFQMNEACAGCALKFEREPGYFVGAIYINYAATTVLAIGGFLALDALTTLSLTAQMIAWSVFAIVFPLLFFRHSKSLWLAIDYIFNPEEPQLRVVRGRSAP